MNRPERRGNGRRGKPAGTQWSPSTSRGIVFRVLQTARRTGHFLTDLVDREFEILTASQSSRLHRGLNLLIQTIGLDSPYPFRLLGRAQGRFRLCLRSP